MTKKHDRNYAGFITKNFIGLLSVCARGRFCYLLPFNSKGPIQYESLSNWTCQTRPTLVDINSNEALFYAFTVSVNK